MGKQPRTDVQRQDAAHEVRFSLPPSANPTIVAFVTGQFAPIDDTWNTLRDEWRRLRTLEAKAIDQVAVSRTAVETAVRQLAASLVDDTGRADHDARQQAFGATTSELFRSTVRELLDATSGAVIWFSTHAEVAHNAEALSALNAALPQLSADQDALTTVRNAVVNAKTAAFTARDAWDASYKKLRQCVQFNTQGEEWKEYLPEFADAVKKEDAVAPEEIEVSG